MNEDNNSFLKTIETNFGKQKCKLFKTYMKMEKTIATITSKRNFLTLCRRNNVFPRFITDMSSNYNTLFNECPCPSKVYFFIEKIKRGHLNLSIRNVYKSINVLKKNKYKQRCIILSSFPHELARTFLEKQKEYSKKRLLYLSRKLEQKYDVLVDRPQNRNDNEWFVNLTNYNFPDDVSNLLGMGPKFNLGFSKTEIPIPKILSEVESIVEPIKSENNKNKLRAKAVNIITNHKFHHDSNRTMIERKISETKTSTKTFLETHKDIVICRADKGNITVALNKTEYENKMLSLLNDKKTYKEVTKIPISSLENQNNKIIKQLKEKSIIDEITKKKLTTYTGIEAKMYGVIKHHKPGYPARPIVTNVGTVQSELSKWLCGFLTTFMEEDGIFNIKNSWELKKKLEGIKVEKGDTLVSFDVVSLFTCIPRDLLKKILKDKWKELKKFINKNIDWEMFDKILSFCTEETNYFTCLNKKYFQIDGLAMGNCLSPVLADIVMTELLRHVFKILKIKPKLAVKYVDDLLFLLPSHMINQFLQALNSFHENIKFTFEIMVNNRLSYLDMTLEIVNDKIQTFWYKKETNKGRILNFNSAHNFNLKMNTATGLVNRIFSLSSNNKWNQCNKLAFDLLEKNDYPRQLIQRIINQTKNKLINTPSNILRIVDNNDDIPVVENTNIYRSLTYVRGLSEELSTVFRKENSNMKIAFKNNNTVGKQFFTKIKDKTTKFETSGVVYEIRCMDCNKIYIGQTGCKLKNRISKHKSDINTKKEFASELAYHSIINGHKFDFENTRILDIEQMTNKRLFLEMIHINKKFHLCVNKRLDIQNLSSLYSNII